MSKVLSQKKQKDAEQFYFHLLKTLNKKNIRFMIGGTYAFNEYTGLKRPTGDIDIKCAYEEYPKLLKTLSKAGYRTELAEIERDWLAKVFDENNFYTDIIFAERNGLHKIESSWYDYAREATVLGQKVKLEPVEEMIRSKCYIHNRNRDDTGDVVHLILKQGKFLDLILLLGKMDPHWQLLMSHILNFLFIYPSEREKIPEWVIEELMDKLKTFFKKNPTEEKVTRGLLLSNDYQVGVAKWGFRPITELR